MIGMAKPRLLAALCLLSAASTAFSQTEPSETAVSRSVSLGLQACPFPVFGLEVGYNPAPAIGLQVVGRIGVVDVDFGLGRVLYRFKRDASHNVYANVLFGVFRDDEVYRDPGGPYETDSAPGFGFGIGYEHFFRGMPRVGWNAEVDFIHVGFEDVWYTYDYESFNLVMVGLGVLYYF